ncbi:MAG: hypothetical protein J5779_01950, partial [Clostridia bacterium]|nr:hypothetical protein [Clostridia bacterium]
MATITNGFDSTNITNRTDANNAENVVQEVVEDAKETLKEIIDKVTGTQDAVEKVYSQGVQAGNTEFTEGAKEAVNDANAGSMEPKVLRGSFHEFFDIVKKAYTGELGPEVQAITIGGTVVFAAAAITAGIGIYKYTHRTQRIA